jgi:hypothetical protein
LCVGFEQAAALNESGPGVRRLGRDSGRGNRPKDEGEEDGAHAS